MLYAFDDFEYDKECRELRRAGMMIPCEPQVFELLGLLIEQRDRVVSKGEIVDTVWDGRFVSDAAVSSRVMAARKALGDDGRKQAFIKTIHGTGFRFISDVDEVTAAKSSSEPRSAIRPGIVLKRDDPRTSLIVLPFRSLDPEPTGTILADAVHEDLTIQLARMPDYRVIARAAAAFNTSLSNDDVPIGDDLGVQYCVTGTVRSSGEMVRINAQVAETNTRHVIAALTFDRKRSELLDLQNLLILEIANSLGAQINLAEIRRIEEDAARDPTAYFHFKRSEMLISHRGWNKSTISKVVGHLEAARAIDPDFAPAISMQALVMGFSAPYGLLGKPHREVKPQVMDLAAEGIEKDPHRSTVLGWSGCAFCDVGETDAGFPHLERAIEIDPSNAQGRAALGWANLQKGDSDKAIDLFLHAIAISPNLPGHAFWLCGLARAYQQKGNRPELKRSLETAIRLDPAFALPYFGLSEVARADGNDEASATYLDRAQKLIDTTPELASGFKRLGWFHSSV